MISCDFNETLQGDEHSNHVASTPSSGMVHFQKCCCSLLGSGLRLPGLSLHLVQQRGRWNYMQKTGSSFGKRTMDGCIPTILLYF